MGISPPQNLRLSEDKNFVSHPPSKKGKKNFHLYWEKAKDRSIIGILCNLGTPQLSILLGTWANSDEY